MNGIISAAELFRVLTALDFDVAAGVELCGGDDEFYCDLIRELHSDVLVLRADALGRGNPQTRKNYAHLLKGTLQVLGEKNASQHAREREQARRHGEPDGDLNRNLLDELDRIDLLLGHFFAKSSR